MLSPLLFSGDEGMVDREEKGDEVEDESIAGAMAWTELHCWLGVGWIEMKVCPQFECEAGVSR